MLSERLYGGIGEKSIGYPRKVYRVFSDRTIHPLRSLPSPLRYLRTNDPFPPIPRFVSFVQTIRYLPYFASFPSCKRSGTTHLPFGRHVTYDSFPPILRSVSIVQTRHAHTSTAPISPILCSVALVETLCVLLFYASTSSIQYGNLSG